jgi:hypothetical protein
VSNTGKFTSVPYTPFLKNVPVGNVLSSDCGSRLEVCKGDRTTADREEFE